MDIQAKLAEGKGTGFARWAKQHNLKEMSRTLVFLQENKIGSIEEMQELLRAQKNIELFFDEEKKPEQTEYSR